MPQFKIRNKDLSGWECTYNFQFLKINSKKVNANATKLGIISLKIKYVYYRRSY